MRIWREQMRGFWGLLVVWYFFVAKRGQTWEGEQDGCQKDFE